MLPMLVTLVGALNSTIPMMATGILFKLPTRLYVVGVVVDRNHRAAYDIEKPTTQDTAATARNHGDWIALSSCIEMYEICAAVTSICFSLRDV